MYNAYIPREGPYEKIPEEHPPGPDLFSDVQKKGDGLLSGLLGRLGKLDSGDLLLFLVLLLLLKEKEEHDPILLLALAAVFLLDGDG